MNNFDKAIDMAAKARADRSPKFPVGARVIACNDCYYNEPGTVINHETNLIGLLLNIVELDCGTETCFYTYELAVEL